MGNVLEVIRAKPNPHGKDLGGWGITKEAQLLGEWVDIKNNGNESLYLFNICLANSQFNSQCTLTKSAVIYWNGNLQALKPGEIARLHTGQSCYANQMQPVDRNDVHLHLFAEKKWFVLNNSCGDTISIWWKKKQEDYECLDKASYYPNPPDGAILHRVGFRLIP